MKIRAVSAAVVCAFLAACQSAPQPAAKPVVAPVVAQPVAESWVRTEIVFGLAPAEAEGLGLSAAEGTWRAFLDEEVTPRFPDGVTVLDAQGQGRADDKSPIERSRSRVLVLVRPDTASGRAGIDALCAAYKTRTGAKEVLVVDIPIMAPRR